MLMLMEGCGRIGRSIALALVGVVLPHVVAAADLSTDDMRPPEALEQLWNENMLAGEFGRYYNGTVTRLNPASCAQPNGWIWIHDVARAGCGLSVVDLRERRGLKSHGGWVLEGGLLGRRDVDEQRVELYGRREVRHEPYLQPWPHVWIGMKSWKTTHKFFLIRRGRHGERAVILRRWILPDPQASGGYSFVTRARLECPQSCEAVRVHVMNGHDRDLISESVHVATALGQ
jgi:hypothetical protein